MFWLFRAKNPYEQPARAVYAAVMERVREPVFYDEFAVPDSTDGRFDLLLLHLFMVIRAHKDKEGRQFAQALFDITFAHMDQNLREAGVGDMGVPKHMRRMMKAFNGRMHGYEKALAAGEIEEALKRNVYGTMENPPETAARRLAGYVMDNISYIEGQDFNLVAAGKIAFAPFAQERKYGT